MPNVPESLAPFRNQRFLAYWLTGLLANLGWHIQLVGASWLMVSLGGTPEFVALVQTAVALPIMLFSMPAGAITDAIGRRSMVIFSQSFLLIVSVVLAVCAYLGLLSPWLLLAFTFLIGSGKALNHPAWQSMVSEIISREELPPAISLNSAGFSLARSVGPAVGGVIVAVAGAFAAFLVNAVSNLGVILAVSRWPLPTERNGLPPESFGSAVATGIRYVSMSPRLLVVMLRGSIFTLAGTAVMTLMPLIARDLVGGGPRTFGLLLGAFGAGAVCGALGGSTLQRVMSIEGTVRTGYLLFAFATVFIGLSTNYVLSMLAAALAGGSWLMTMSTFNTLIQTSSPRWVLSRCVAIYQTVTFGGVALGSWIWGMTASSYGISVALLISAIALGGGVVLGVFFSVPTLETTGLDTHGPWKAPDLSLNVLPGSGPIITTIVYRIREVNSSEFFRIMAERRQDRRRDGARRWSLSRSLMDSELWYERFETPTWIETQRHHQRRTVAGAQISVRIRELHQGRERPTVHYELVRHQHELRERAEVIDDYSQ